jgi:hypothetical protein
LPLAGTAEQRIPPASGWAVRALSVNSAYDLAEVEPLIQDLIVTLEWDRGRAEALILDYLTTPGTSAEDWSLFQLAERVQEFVLEERLDTSWPECPRDGRHPLWLDPTDRPLVWRCPLDGREIAPLGDLPKRTRRPR